VSVTRLELTDRFFELALQPTSLAQGQLLSGFAGQPTNPQRDRADSIGWRRVQ
jgi:hypothetical protein